MRKSYCLLLSAAPLAVAPAAPQVESRTSLSVRPMTTTADVLKPDFASQRKHFIFTDEHEQLRESIRRFVIKELQPHAEEWEETTFPDWVFERMGELGLPRARQARASTAARAATTTPAWCWPRRSRHAHCGGLAMGVAVQTDMAMPPILAFGTEEQKQEWAVPAIAGKEILCLGITEPDAGSDVAGIKTRAVTRRRRVRHQRLQDVHHQRPPRPRDRARDQDRPGRRLRRLHAVPGADGQPRRDPREAPEEARHARLRHRAARLPGRARARIGGARARSARASTTSCGSSRASA